MVFKMKNEYLENIIEIYGDMVYRLALARTRKKELAEDAFQDVFLRIAKRNPEFKNEKHEKAYIIKTTINCTKTLINSKVNNLEDLKENLVFETNERNTVYFTILELPIKYRTVIHLFYYEGYKTSEISKLLNKNENTIKSHLKRAREILKKKLEGGIEDE